MATNGQHKATQRRLDAAERQRQALELRKAGASFDQIAAQLGYRDRSAAYRAVMAALKATLREPAEEVRKLELERLDRLTLALWARAKEGEAEAIDRVLKLMDRRARLLGLDVQPGAVTAERTTGTRLSEWLHTPAGTTTPAEDRGEGAGCEPGD